MDLVARKSYLENTLLYLEKDWEWSPILLSALAKGDLDEAMISVISEILSDAIESCQDDEKRAYLIHAQDVVRDYMKQERDSKKTEQNEANTLIESFI